MRLRWLNWIRLGSVVVGGRSYLLVVESRRTPAVADPFVGVGQLARVGPFAGVGPLVITAATCSLAQMLPS